VSTPSPGTVVEHACSGFPPGGRRSPRRRRFVPPAVGAVLVGVALLAGACGGSSSPSSSPHGAGAGGAGARATIVIQNFAFSPAKTTVAPGATVTVDNKDGVTHTLTSTSGGFTTGDVAAGQTKTFTAPSKAGSYPYICEIHQYMTGTLVVS
jgi:plastocyanin